MAAKVGSLFIELTGDTSKFSKALADAGVRVRGFETKTNASFKSLDGTVSKSMGGIATALAAAFSAQAAIKFIDTATKIQNALKVAGLRGAELKAVYEQLYAAAQKNGVPVEALATLYGKASQAQKELGASTSDLISFSSNVALALRVAGTDAETASGALLQLGQALGSGTVHAEEFNSVLEGAPTIVKAVAAGLKEAGGSVSQLKALIIDGKVTSEAFFRAFEAGAPVLEQMAKGSTLTIAQQFTQLQNAIVDAAGKMDTATGASSKLGAELQELSGFITSLGNAFVTVAESDLGKFIGRIYEAYAAVRELKNFLGGLSGTFSFMNTTLNDAMTGKPVGQTAAQAANTASQDYAQSRINDAFSADPKTGRIQATATPVEPVSIADFKPPVSKPKKAGKAKESDYERKVGQIQDSTQALQLENQALSMVSTSTGNWETAQAKARAEADLLVAAMKSGVAVTPELRAKITDLAGAYATAEAESRKLQKAHEDSAAAVEDFKNTSKDITSGFISDLRNGKSAAEALENALNKVADKLIDVALNSAFGIGQTGTGTGLLAGIGKLFGFADGGYTGDGGKNEPKGTVHGGEFVLTKKATQRAGVGNLYGLMDYLENGSVSSLVAANGNMPGYASGGYVGSFSAPALNAPDNTIRSQMPGDAASINDPRGITVTVDKKGNLKAFINDAVQSSEQRTNMAMRQSQKSEAKRVASYRADSDSRKRRPL